MAYAPVETNIQYIIDEFFEDLEAIYHHKHGDVYDALKNAGHQSLADGYFEWQFIKHAYDVAVGGVDHE